jgi:hypothetical protein
MSSDEVPFLGPTRPKWLLPVAIIAAVVAIGGVAAYFLSNPHTTATTATENEPPKRVEPAAEEPLNTGAFVPPPSPDQERAKAVNLQPREVEPKEAYEPEKVPSRPARPAREDGADRVDRVDRLPPGNAGKRKAGAKSGGKAASSGGFKAVGD